jgi:hypothetical protein
MSSKPSTIFSRAYSTTVDSAILQLGHHEATRSRMTAGALALVAALAVSLTAAPAPVHAQNQIQRAAADVFGGIIGGALGSQVGGGRGRKAAEVAGLAAGVWASESVQGNNANTTNRTQRGSVDPNIDRFGPSGWNNSTTDTRMTDTRVQRSRTVASVSSGSGASLLQSGNVALTAERTAKLNEMEQSFLASRDKYARSIYTAQQLQDDLVLSPSSRSLQQQISAAEGQKRSAENEYAGARQPFVEALEHLGARGYDVHQYAYSYQLTRARVTAGDMRRGDLGQAIHGRNNLNDTEQMRGDTYEMR